VDQRHLRRSDARSGCRRWALRAAAVATLGAVAVGSPSSAPLPAPELFQASFADPAPPTNVRVTSADRSLLLSWTSSVDAESGYRVYVDGVLKATPTGTSTTINGLLNGQQYTITIKTYTRLLATSEGTVASAPVQETPRDKVPPAAPTMVVPIAGDRQVSLTWRANTAAADYDVDGYRVLRDGVAIRELLGSRAVAAYTDSGLVNDRVYGYTVQTHDTSGNWSASSTPVATATPKDRTPPAVPSGLVATPRDRAVELAWTPDPDVATYQVLRDGLVVSTVTGTSFRDVGLTNGTTYRYQLVGVDAAGNASAASAPAVPGTPVAPADTTPPAAPSGLVATPGDGAVELAWTPDLDVATYRVLRDGVVVSTVIGTSFRDVGLTNGTTYRYQLVGVDAAGNASAASTPAVPGIPVAPADTTPPAAPSGVTAVPGDGSAVLRWTAPGDPDVTSYQVLVEGGGVLLTVPVTSGGPAQQVTVPGLTNGSTYRFIVVAVDGSGNVSLPSAAVPVTPRAATVPPAPTTVPVLGAGESGGLAVSGGGRFVVVGTRAQLEAADTNTAYELYLLDRTAGAVRRIAPLPATATGAGDPTNTSAPAVSDDGRYVVLATTAALVPTDTNRLADVYRLDTTTGDWAPVSVPAGGRPSAVAGTVLQPGSSVYATSPSVSLSADGDLVLFYSARADLVARDTNGVVDVFAKSMSTGAVTRVSTTATGTELPRTALGPALALTPDGRFALFPATGPNGPVVLYRKTLSGPGAGEATVVSAVLVSGRKTEFGVYRDVGDVDVSDDGRYVALVTSAKLGTTPTASWPAGLAHRIDTATGTSVAMGNGQSTIWEHQVALDPTGRYGFFATAAPETPGDDNGHTDHLRRDLDGGVLGPLLLVTADAAGRTGPGPVGSITSAEYGRVFPVTGDQVLVTTSQALLPTDTNRLRDVYAKDLVGGAVLPVVG